MIKYRRFHFCLGMIEFGQVYGELEGCQSILTAEKLAVPSVS
jgi:hypothetical protein